MQLTSSYTAVPTYRKSKPVPSFGSWDPLTMAANIAYARALHNTLKPNTSPVYNAPSQPKAQPTQQMQRPKVRFSGIFSDLAEGLGLSAAKKVFVPSKNDVEEHAKPYRKPQELDEGFEYMDKAAKETTESSTRSRYLTLAEDKFNSAANRTKTSFYKADAHRHAGIAAKMNGASDSNVKKYAELAESSKPHSYLRNARNPYDDVPEYIKAAEGTKKFGVDALIAAPAIVASIPESIAKGGPANATETDRRLIAPVQKAGHKKAAPFESACDEVYEDAIDYGSKMKLNPDDGYDSDLDYLKGKTPDTKRKGKGNRHKYW